VAGKKKTPTRAVSQGLKQSTITGESKGVRFIDGLITIIIAMLSVIWTATRPTEGQQLGWGLFWTLLGGLMGVQGTHELRYGGFGVAGANAAYLSLRLFHPNLASTGATVNFVQDRSGTWRHVGG